MAYDSEIDLEKNDHVIKFTAKSIEYLLVYIYTNICIYIYIYMYIILFCKTEVNYILIRIATLSIVCTIFVFLIKDTFKGKLFFFILKLDKQDILILDPVLVIQLIKNDQRIFVFLCMSIIIVIIPQIINYILMSK